MKVTRTSWRRFCLCTIVFVASTASAQETSTPKAKPPKAALKSLTAYPPQVSLDSPRAEQRLGVLGAYQDGRTWDLSRDATYSTNNEKIAVVDKEGVVRPVSDGQAVISLQAGGQTTTIPVKVTKATADIPVSFSREIVPILTKAGCNGGACHGSQHGRGGFKLSLFGFDPLFDHPQIVQSAEGRRIVLSAPEQSILLQKPTLTMEHGGGERFKVNSREYMILKKWLEDGVPEPAAKDPIVTGLEVWPSQRIVVPGEQQQLIVKATWQDGRKEDVTTTAQYDSLNDAVAAVTPTGLVTAKGPGETHIMIRFAGQATVAQFTLPYSPPLTKGGPGGVAFTPNNFIDEKLLTKWKGLGLAASPECKDEEFFRRIHLDGIGSLPPPEDIRAFLADKSPDKRKKAIDRVLDRPEFIDFWASKWGDLLRINRDFLQDRGMWSFHNWVRASLRDRKPVDEMVREIITAEGSTFTEGPANFYMVARNPADWAETASQVFLGVRITCAKCHHHPFEKWSQDDYYGMAAFFSRLGTKNSQEFGLFGREQVVYLKATGEQTHPRKGGVVPPHPLDGPSMNDPIDRRVKLAEWMTSPSNPFFAKNIVNRFWAYLMGRGLVEPIDDIRATNPASNPELVDALAKDFVANKFDLRHLIKTIMNSRAYQLAAVTTPANKDDVSNIHYTRYTVRRLSAEQLADALDFATGTQEKYAGLPLGTRAIQLPDTRVKSFLLDVFGRPSRQIVCECERTTQPNIAQALHLLNGDFLNKKLSAANGRLEKLLKAKKQPAEIVEELYLVTLSRQPRREETDRAIQWMNRAANAREGAQDLLWALVNSREFLFNH